MRSLIKASSKILLGPSGEVSMMRDTHGNDIHDLLCIFGEHHCFHWKSPNGISSYLYLLGFFLALITGIHRSAMKEHGHNTLLFAARRIAWFPSMISFAFLCRVAWLILKDINAFQVYDSHHSTYHHVSIKFPILNLSMDLYPVGVTLIGKIATLVYFSAFTIIVLFWNDMLMISLHKMQVGKATTISRISSKTLISESANKIPLHSKSKTFFLIVNVWMYLVEFTFVGLLALFPQYKDILLDMNSIMVAMAFFILSVAMAYFAYKLRGFFRQIESSKIFRFIQFRVTMLAICCFLFFGLRSFLLFWSPIVKHILKMPASQHFHGALGKFLYPWFFYTAPELVPAGMLLFTMLIQKRSKYRKLLLTRTEARPEHQPLIIASSCSQSDVVNRLSFLEGGEGAFMVQNLDDTTREGETSGNEEEKEKEKEKKDGDGDGDRMMFV